MCGKRGCLLNNSEKGFTLVEVLVAISILVFGVSYIFPIFFESSSSLRHINNRMNAAIIMDDEALKMKNYINNNEVTAEYAYKKSTKDGPGFSLDVHLKKLGAYNKLYKLEMTTSWIEGRRGVKLNRMMYLKSS